jgi:hypothetical protein
MSESGKLYGFTRIIRDAPNCVTGLWEATREFIRVKGLTNTTFFEEWTEPAVFYNNFESEWRSLR